MTSGRPNLFDRGPFFFSILGSSSYRLQGSEDPLESLGLRRIADVPCGGVARSLAAYLVSDDVDTFVHIFHQDFDAETTRASVQLPEPFVFAEYLTFARVVPFEEPSLSADSLGSILTARDRGEEGYMYHEDTGTLVLAVSIPAGVVICGSAPGMTRALDLGLRLTEIRLRLEMMLGSLNYESNPST